MSPIRRVLHIGADSKGQELPQHFRGWERICFDINPRHDAEFVGDVRNMEVISDASFDAAVLSGVLEYFHPWEIPSILAEAARAVKMGGFLEIRVPDAEAIFAKVLEGHPVDSPLYHTTDGPMTPQNLIHGRIGRTRNSATFMAHRTVFTAASLRLDVRNVGLKVELEGECSDMPYHRFCIARRTDEDVVDPIDEILEAVSLTTP